MSEYQNFDHAAWMQKEIDIKRYKKRKGWEQLPVVLNYFQKQVCNIVGIIGSGLYNAPVSIDSIDWNYGSGVAMNWKREIATFDFNQLTVLVFLCHQARIRCSIEGTGPGQLKLAFWPRKAEGQVAVRHPNLDEAVQDFYRWFKPMHQINYRETDEPDEPKADIAEDYVHGKWPT